jgi:serine/threonine protein kinase
MSLSAAAWTTSRCTASRQQNQADWGTFRTGGTPLLCAVCCEETRRPPCAHCGAEPRLEGRYALVERVGAGAFGTTYRATDALGGVVAVKELPLRPGTPDKLVELFRREASVLRQLSHPHIPSWVEDFTSGSGKARALYIVTSFVEGPTLEAWMAEHRFSAGEVLELIDQLAGVLSYLHGRSPAVIHRDLKPSNVICSDHGLVLVDFGTVRDAVAGSIAGGSTVAGTFGFMAPEQAVGDADARTDLYALGAIAVALLTRMSPAKLVHARGIGWRAHATVPEPFARILDSLVSFEPQDRPSSADELRSALDDVRSGRASSAAVVKVEPSLPAVQAEQGSVWSTRRSATLPVRMGPHQHGAVTAALDAHLSTPSRLQVVGDTLRWKSSGGRNLQITLQPAGGETLLFVREHHGPLFGGLFGGLVGGVGGGLGLGGAGAVAGLLAAMGAGAFLQALLPAVWAMALMGSSAAVAVALWRKLVADRERELDETVGLLRDVLAKTANDPEPPPTPLQTAARWVVDRLS